MFIGEYVYSIDEKRRVGVPSKFRKELGREAVITRGLDNCLVLYPMKEWVKLAQKLQDLPVSRGEARSFVRIMLSGAIDVGFDKLGRILIPDYLKKYASLKKNIVIIGLGNRIEVWDEGKWHEYKTRTETRVEDLAAKLDTLGI